MVLDLVAEDRRELQRSSSIPAGKFDTSRAIKHLLLALENARERESAIELGRGMFGFGVVYWRRGDVQQAETSSPKSLKQRRMASDAGGIIMSLNIVGRFARYQGRTR